MERINVYPSLDVKRICVSDVEEYKSSDVRDARSSVDMLVILLDVAHTLMVIVEW